MMTNITGICSCGEYLYDDEECNCGDGKCMSGRITDMEDNKPKAMNNNKAFTINWIAFLIFILLAVWILTSCGKVELQELHNAKNIKAYKEAMRFYGEYPTKDPVAYLVPQAPLNILPSGNHTDTLNFQWNGFSTFDLSANTVNLLVIWLHDGDWRQAGQLRFLNCDSVVNTQNDGLYVVDNDGNGQVKWVPFPTGYGYPQFANQVPYIDHSQVFSMDGQIINHSYQPVPTDTMQTFSCVVEWYY